MRKLWDFPIFIEKKWADMTTATAKSCRTVGSHLHMSLESGYGHLCIMLAWCIFEQRDWGDVWREIYGSFGSGEAEPGIYKNRWTVRENNQQDNC